MKYKDKIFSPHLPSSIQKLDAGIAFLYVPIFMWSSSATTDHVCGIVIAFFPHAHAAEVSTPTDTVDHTVGFNMALRKTIFMKTLKMEIRSPYCGYFGVFSQACGIWG